ncbi:MAG: hypothetical protein A2Y64_07640 [Candidatus Coatesbacteria bacterium RBG_13_66_14]|uniref:Restriction endonuclease n=1 Tax=Candidatus Coatesbacteria bacterium RBG_13_66_14 TaxID=1817816 RepID=A0A1F5EWC6_9BACT|nr:MAG: hypothetical protein A2Y64_07640 [Candidatus Coatesbacteria bacterium RBG_13_66_14]
MSSLVKLSPAKVKRLLEQFLRVADVHRAGLHDSRETHLRLVRSLVKKDRLARLDRTALQALIGTLWSFRFWRNADFILESALAVGLPEVRKQLHDLLYGTDDIVLRYDRLFGSPIRFDTAAISELLSVNEPERYAVRNISSRKGLFRLRAEELPLVTHGQITGAEYVAYCTEINRLRERLNEVEPVFRTLYDVDFFLYFAAYEAQDEERESLAKLFAEAEQRRRTESPAGIRLALLELGDRMGLGVWAGGPEVKSLRRRKDFKKLERVLDEPPVRYDDFTDRLLADVDVIWFEGKKIAALFEVEPVEGFSEGLLRLADLVNHRKSFNAPVYIVAPDDHWERVVAEVTRPAFENLPRPLAACCRFLPASAVEMILEKLGDTVSHMTPGSLKQFSTAVE